MSARILIAEDEPVLAEVLAATLRGLWPGVQVVAQAPNGIAAVEQALALRPDALFLDIKMPGRSGIEAVEDLLERWDRPAPFPQVVFVTAYDDYAVQAFDNAALDYVLKPVSAARLARTVERVRRRLAVDASAPADDGAAGTHADAAAGTPDRGLARLVEQMRALLPAVVQPAVQLAVHPAVQPDYQEARPDARLDIIRAAVGNVVRMIRVEDVVFFQALDKYVNVATAEGDALIRLPLKELLAHLDGGRFCQVSRGSIVNLRHVASASRDDLGKLTLALRGRPERLRVSPLFAHLFRQM